MTTAEAAARRADRLAKCRARAERLGYRIEESPTGGFFLLGRGMFQDEAVEEGLPEIEDWLATKEAESGAATTNGETP